HCVVRRNDRAPRFQEPLERAHAGLAEAATHVIRRAVHAEKAEPVRLPVWLRVVRRPEQNRIAVEVLRRHYDHVVVRFQTTLRDALLVDQIVGYAEAIERVAVPTELLRAVPLRVDGDA